MLLKKSTLALTLTTALLAMSCAAPKKTMQEQREQTHSSLSQTATAESHQEDSAAISTERLLNELLTAWLQRVETRDEATERVTEIFDTSQPPDSTTGTPPLSARIRERHEARSRSDSRAKVEAAKSDSTATDIKATAATDTAEVIAESQAGETEATQTEAETSGESETESREEKGGNKALVWVSIALSLLSIAVIAIVIKHRSNRH